MNDMEQSYRDLVSLEVKGEAPEGTRERLMADPQRWRMTLNEIRMEMAAHLAHREAELAQAHTDCYQLSDGAARFAVHRNEFLRWKANSKRFRVSLDSRIAEVVAICKQTNRDDWQVQEVEEWKAHCRDLIAAVGDLLALPDDESIPADVWGRLIDAYDALPFWMHHAKKYRNQEQLAAD